MATFDPSVVIAILGVTTNDGKKFSAAWKKSVADRVRVWTKNRATQSVVAPQLEWEANIVEYVDFVHHQTRVRGANKSGKPSPDLPAVVPIFGPRFVPPTFLDIRKRNVTPNIQPETTYLLPLNIVHPFYYPEIGICPQCGASDVSWDSWTGTGPREVHGVRREERALGYQIRCQPCSQKYAKNGTHAEENKQYCFATTGQAFWQKWEHWEIPAGIPYFMSRCAVTHELFDMIVELRPSLTSGGLAENIKQLHLLAYHQDMRTYLQTFRDRRRCAFTPVPLKAFSQPSDLKGYNNESITDDMITDIFLDFSNRTRKEESSEYLRTLTAVCMSLDNTFKSAGKAMVVDQDRVRKRMMRGGVLSIINEMNEIISWRLCQSNSAAEIQETLEGLKRRWSILKQIQETLEGLKRRWSILKATFPELSVADNCCQVRNAILAVFPDIQVVLDVYHFLMRYLAVILNGTQNPYRSEVAKEIVDAILISRAGPNISAKYWTKDVQEQKLVATFEKWSKHGSVWSAAALSVHSAQVQHVRKGCLARVRQDIRTDGSRIEGSHKGWNSLQRSFASGLELHEALSHDFVLRRNVRTALANSSDKKVSSFSTTFVQTTLGSHHVRLASNNAVLWNTLLEIESKKPGKLAEKVLILPALTGVLSGETFGLVSSEHTDTFGGLFTIKPEDDDQEVALLGHDDFDADTVLREIGVDPALLRVSAEHHAGATSLPAIKDLARTTSDPRNGKGARGSATIDLTIETTYSGYSNGKRKDLHTLDGEDHLEIEEMSAKKKTRIEANTETQYWKADPSKTFTDSSAVPLSKNSTQPEKVQNGIQSFFSSSLAVSSSSSAEKHLPVASRSPLIQDLKHLTSRLPPPQTAGLTRSERLFAAGTGVSPYSLTIAHGREFFLFMDMREEFQWTTFNMTSKRWMDATNLYNARLQVIEQGNKDEPFIRKNPRALLEKLGEMEPKIADRVAKKNYRSKQGTETFWKRHCHAVSLVKTESASAGPETATRKPATCSRCCAIMYPGPSGAPENHKKGYCSDGFKQKLPKGSLDKPPPWPQPIGIFANGTHFYPLVFLAAVREVYEKVIVEGSTELSMEHGAFISLLADRVASADGAVLFKLFSDFTSPPGDTTPDGLFVDYKGYRLAP